MSADDHKQALPQGFRLGPYHVVRVLGVGGFGVTYLCEHAGLGVQVAVKEYLPNEIAVRYGTEVHPKSAGDREGFEWGLSRFLDEARTLGRFEHPNVVRVRDCFEANNTAYIVMDYEDGEPLDALLRRHGTLTEGQLKRVVLPVVDGLRQVHAAGFLHRDIKPSNIFVRRSDESPVLLDFGSARQALGRRSRSVTAIASPGYSPPEQYASHGAQGAWTDIYALSALCYRAITGDAPAEAPWRQSQLLRTRTDPLPRLAERRAASYSPAFLEAVDWGLRPIETERPQSLEEWLTRLEGAATRQQSQNLELRKAKRASSSPAHRTDERKTGKGRYAVWLLAALGALLAIGLGMERLVARTDTDPSVSPHATSPTTEPRHRSASGDRVSPEVGERFRDCAQCPEMVVVPAGSFLMGSPATEEGRDKDEGPVHRVWIAAPFAVGVYEVTFAEWGACEASGGCGRHWLDRGSGRRPVVNVSWDDAQTYVRWLSSRTGKRYRLPSESEWEYAARAGTRTPFHTGQTISTEQANYAGEVTYRGQTVPVGTFSANGWGLHDVHGNVWEWTEDCWNGSYTGAPLDGSAWQGGYCSGRVLRGGSWSNDPSVLRAASRVYWSSSSGYNNLGFRVARTLAP